MELLTHSRMDSFKTCRKKHSFAYELGLRRIDAAKALRQGSAFHDGIAALANGHGTDGACGAVHDHYKVCPEFIDPLDWAFECETIYRLICAYDWRWASSPIEYLAVELPFELPLVNPATGKATPIFNLAGKIDAIVRLEDGRLAVKETKTLSDSLDSDSDLWRRLKRDSQISIYIIAARKLGYAVDTVLYDCVRKPSIAPAPVPILDENGVKIVTDLEGNRVRNANKTWRQTADKDKGYEIRSRAMTPQEWGERLTADIVSRPEWYFNRQEVPRLDSDIAETEAELWEIQLAMREAQRSGHWFRTVNRNTCPYCSYDAICDRDLSDGAVPPGFVKLGFKHPELNTSKGGIYEASKVVGNTGTATDSEVPLLLA